MLEAEIVRVAEIVVVAVGVLEAVADADVADVPAAVEVADVMAVTVVAAEAGTRIFATDFHGSPGSKTNT